MLHRDDRLTRLGEDTAIAVKSSIDHNRVVLLPLTNLEATAVQLSKVLGSLLLFTANKPLKSELLSADLSAHFTEEILAGDLNCKIPLWGSHFTNQNERLLYRLVFQLPDCRASPTYVLLDMEPSLMC